MPKPSFEDPEGGAGGIAVEGPSGGRDGTVHDATGKSSGGAGTETGGCSSDEDCGEISGATRCDSESAQCVECLGDDDCEPGYYCTGNHLCKLGCRADEDCAEGTRCNLVSHYCVGCEGPADCPPNHTCETATKTCIAACQGAEDCSPEHECCSGLCRAVLDSVEHCGSCGAECPAIHGEPLCDRGECGIVCASGRGDCNENARRDGCETDLLNATLHCGECDRPCTNAHGGTDCVDGVCVPECISGFDDCDRDPANGCEQDVVNDPENCGGCRQACDLPHAEPGCEKSSCIVVRCDEGWTDCDQDPANGCEADVSTDVLNCGECGRPCATTHGEPTCDEGTCSITCAADFDDCDGDPMNGCEINLEESVLHCSECGAACPDEEGTPSCDEGKCFIAQCSGELGDCDNDRENGCEADFRTDPRNCAACGVECLVANGEAACSNGICEVAGCIPADLDSELPGYGDCNDDYADGCEQVLNTLKHCGACDAPCTAEQNVHSVSCASGVCSVSNCMLPWGDCNGSPLDGCEVDTSSAVHHCGACGAPCSSAHGTPTCANAVCSITCNANYDDCDGNAMANGCEAHLLTDPNNCGSCEQVCVVAHGTPGCADGECTVAACDAGFADCDRDPKNGCEVDTNSSEGHCGACDTPCELDNVAAQTCEAGLCRVQDCLTDFGDCNDSDADGCEVNLTINTRHCGECGAACDLELDPAHGTLVCQSAVCSYSDCTAPHEECDEDEATPCEANTSSNPLHCGGCNLPCSYPNASGVCSNATCAFGACAEGWGDCDPSLANGCETNTMTSVAHCGACQEGCSTDHGVPTCGEGECTIACEADWGDCDEDARSNGCETSLTANSTHCGACNQSCEAGQLCEDGECIDRPCTGLCSDPLVITALPYNEGDLGTGAICHETTAGPSMLVCGNMVSRVLTVNGTTVSCGGGTQLLSGIPLRAGGHCIQVTAGSPDFAYYQLL